jgi:hypothetical protein
MPRRNVSAASLLALGLASIGCRDESTSSTGAAPSTTAASTTSPTSPDPTAADAPVPDAVPPPAAAIDPRAPQTMVTMGPQPGFVAGGAFHAAVRIDAVLPWLRAIPLSGEVARDLAEIGSETRIDWRVEDLGRRFALAPDPVVSMTLLRPVDAEIDMLRDELLRSPSVVDAVSEAMAASKPKEAPIPGVPVAPPVVLTEVEREHGRDLLATAQRLGLHSRFAVKVTDPKPLMDYVRSMTSAETGWSGACAGLGDAVCVGESDAVLIVRATPTEVIADAMMFVTQVSPDSPGVRALLPELLAGASDGRDHGLVGDAAISADMAAVLRIGVLDSTRRALSSIRWSDSNRTEAIAQTFEHAKVLRELAAATTMFSGGVLAFDVEGDDLSAEAKWTLVPAQAQLAREAFETSNADAMVPALGPLCDGALLCFRSGGLPRPTTLADRLAQGHYADGVDALEDKLGRLDEIWAMHAIAGGWPNALGALAREPQREAGGGPAGAMVGNLVDAIGRTMGTGGSIRTAGIVGGRLSIEYAMYVRTTAADAAIPRALLGLVGEPMTEVTLADDLGSAAMLKIPEDVPPMVLMTRADPATAVPAGHGWVAMVDAPDRLSWLLGLPMEVRDGPALFAEMPDLGRWLTAVAPIVGDVEYLRGWAEGRGLQMTVEVKDGVPVVRARLGRSK